MRPSSATAQWCRGQRGDAASTLKTAIAEVLKAEGYIDVSR